MYTFDRLPGAARGYRQPGKRLRPRDAYLAHIISHGDFHSTREFMRAQAGELAAYGPDREFSPYRHVSRTLDLLPARTRKRIEQAFEDFIERDARPTLPPAQQRVLAAMLRAETVDRCLQADDRLWRNAR